MSQDNGRALAEATEAVLAKAVPAMRVAPAAAGPQAVKMVARQIVNNKIRRAIGSSPKTTDH